MTLAELDAQLDVALGERVAAHRDRQAGRIDVPTYLARLKSVRDIEDKIEPERRRLGATHSRAFEVSMALLRGPVQMEIPA